MKIKTFMLQTLAIGAVLSIFAGNQMNTLAKDDDMNKNVNTDANTAYEHSTITLAHTDVLNNLINVDRLFYNGSFVNQFVVNTAPYLNVYTEENSESSVAGKIYPASIGEVVQWGPEWTEIKSGSVTGYLPTKELHIGYDAEKMAKDLGAFKIKVTADSLNIRGTASADGEIIDTANRDAAYTVIDQDDAWVHVKTDASEGYVSKEFVESFVDLKEAVLPEVEKKKEKEIVTETEKDSKTASNSDAAPEMEKEPVSVSSDEEYLLACMVYVESGAESYEGQLAVANVIMNRVRSASFPNSIAEVIYAPGQFPGAHNGVLDGVLASGPSESTVQAAREAIAGVNNIGDYMFFNGYVDTSSVGSYTVIGGHTFYNY